MIIEKILKQLTPERIEKEIKDIRSIEFLPDLKKWVKAYEAVGERNSYIWSWTMKSIPLITLPGIHPQYHRSLYNLKFLLVMFVVLLDDVADRFKKESLLNEILKVPFSQTAIKLSRLNPEEKKYLKFSLTLSSEIKANITKYPRYDSFGNIFQFDLKQIINAMEYAYLVGKNNYIINQLEYWMYFPHNLPAILSLTVDLMVLPKFDIRELGTMREIAWHVQKLTQGMNWITTWEREIYDNDFTSGIFAYAINRNVIKINELKKSQKRDLIGRIKRSEIENLILGKCSESYREIQKLGEKIKTIDIEKYLISLNKFIVFQSISKGNY